LVRAGQLAKAGRLTAGSSPIGAMVSSVMYRRPLSTSAFLTQSCAGSQRECGGQDLSAA
jgi:hypothetical protein